MAEHTFKITRIFDRPEGSDLLLDSDGSPILVSLACGHRFRMGDDVLLASNQGVLTASKRVGWWWLSYPAEVTTPDKSVDYCYAITRHMGIVCMNFANRPSALMLFTRRDVANRYLRFHFKYDLRYQLEVVPVVESVADCQENGLGVVIDQDVDTGHYVYVPVGKIQQLAEHWAKCKREVLCDCGKAMAMPL